MLTHLMLISQEMVGSQLRQSHNPLISPGHLLIEIPLLELVKTQCLLGQDLQVINEGYPFYFDACSYAGKSNLR